MVDCWGFLTSRAAADRPAMAEGITDTSRVGAHQERFSFVVPKFGIWILLNNAARNGRLILRFILCSSGPERMSGPSFNHTFNNSLAVGCLVRRDLLASG